MSLACCPSCVVHCVCRCCSRTCVRNPILHQKKAVENYWPSFGLSTTCIHLRILDFRILLAQQSIWSVLTVRLDQLAGMISMIRRHSSLLWIGSNIVTRQISITFCMCVFLTEVDNPYCLQDIPVWLDCKTCCLESGSVIQCLFYHAVAHYSRYRLNLHVQNLFVPLIQNSISSIYKAA